MKTGAAPTTAESTSPAATYDAQVSRLGNPLVNEVVVPANLKDYFNRSRPDQDGALLGKVTNPELPYLIELIYGIKNPNKVPGHASRSDLVQVFLTGLPGLNSLDANAVVKATGKPASPAEYLRLNLTTPVTARPNRLGAVGDGWKVALTTLMHERLAVGGNVQRILATLPSGVSVQGGPAAPR